MKSSPKAGRTVRKVMKDGSVRVYRYGPYKAAHADRTFADDSMGALLAAYRRSPEWLGLAEKSRITYSTYLRELEGDPAAKVAAVTRRDLIAVRNAIAATRGNGAGTGFVRAAAAVFGWAVDQEWIEHSPADRVKALPGGHLPAWTAEHVRLALAALSEPLRRVVVLALHTAQRRGDLVRLTWNDYDGATIRLRQEKTGAALAIPVHPDLRVELNAWKAQRDAQPTEVAAVTILTNQHGRPWEAARISEMLGRALAKIDGIPGDLNVHGLRKLGAARLADAGCTTHEIAAITGHRTLSMVELYTRSADQERLATAAIHRLSPRRK